MDGIEIAIEIQHFNPAHDLELSDDEVHYNKKCNGCIKAILPLFYTHVKCSFFLYKSCANLQKKKKKRHPLHQHALSLSEKVPPYILYFGQGRLERPHNTFSCSACHHRCNGFNYSCKTCRFSLDVSCCLISDTLTHPGHGHRLFLASIESKQNCNCCDSKVFPIFRCTTCKFSLDFKCATLPQIVRYKQYEHPFTLYYIAEDDSDEYYCDICEEEQNPKHWFYYCANCSYLAHTKCILGEDLNAK